MKIIITDKIDHLFPREGFYYKEHMEQNTAIERIRNLLPKSSEVVCDFTDPGAEPFLSFPADIIDRCEARCFEPMEEDVMFHYNARNVSFGWSQVLYSRFAERLDWYIVRYMPNATDRLAG